MNRFLILILILAALLLPLTAAAFTLFKGNVPAAAEDIADEPDDQLMTRYSSSDSKNKKLARSQILIMGTTPMNINNLNNSCPLARQMTEEISTRLMENGYRYQDLRKAKIIRFDRNSGEYLLTRNVGSLASRQGTGQAILAGTYIISDKHIRFNISLIHTYSNEVIAKASASIPITADIMDLVEEDRRNTRNGGGGGNGGGSSSVPKTYTRLQ